MARKSNKRGKGKKKNKKYKLKTHKSTAKRFKITGGGKVMRTKGNQGHFRRRKSKRAKMKIGKRFEVSVAKDRQTINRLAPYLRRFRPKGRS